MMNRLTMIAAALVAAGGVQGPNRELLLNPDSPAMQQRAPDVAFGGSVGVVTWTDDNGANGVDIAARLFDGNGKSDAQGAIEAIRPASLIGIAVVCIGDRPASKEISLGGETDCQEQKQIACVCHHRDSSFYRHGSFH